MVRKALLAIAVALIGASAFAQNTIENDFGIFGVKVNGTHKVLTRKLVEAASSEAANFGVPLQHTVSVLPMRFLNVILDEKQMTADELKKHEANKSNTCVGDEGRVMSCTPGGPENAVIVTGVFGGGCIAKPVYPAPALNKKEKPGGESAIGITDLRCGKTEAEFRRLLRVYGSVE
jgi:hypothetical protein